MHRGYAKTNDVNAPAFKFENEGDEVCGTIISVQENIEGKFGAQTIVTIVDGESGESHTIYGGQAVLKRKLDQLMLEPNDEIDIIYEGLGGKEGSTKMFLVAAERDGQKLLPGGKVKASDPVGSSDYIPDEWGQADTEVEGDDSSRY